MHYPLRKQWFQVAHRSPLWLGRVFKPDHCAIAGNSPPPRWYPSAARVRRLDALRLPEFRCSGREGGLPSPPRRQMLVRLFLSDSDFIFSSSWPANRVVYGFSSGGAHPGRGDQIVSGFSSGGMARHREMLIRLFLSRSDLSSALAG